MEKILELTETSTYRVEDQETGNYCIYSGENLEEAKNTILEDESPEMWDLLKNGNRIWCGKTDTINELNAIK